MPESWPGLNSSRSSKSQKTKTTKEFGHNVTFKYTSTASNLSSRAHSGRTSSSTNSPLSSSGGYDSLSDDERTEEASRRSNVITSTLLNGMQQTSLTASRTSASEVRSKLSDRGNRGGTGASVSSLYSASWLKEQCQLCAGDSSLSWKDMYSAMFEVLSSTGDNAAIQNDVSVKCCFFCVKRG